MFPVKILDVLDTIIKVVCTFIMAGIVVLLFYSVVMRYVFKTPVGWSMEVSRYSFLWMIMLCAVLVTREDSHISMSFMLRKMPPKIRMIWQNLLRLMMLGFCLVMVRYGLAIFPIVAEAKSPTLEISMGYMYVAIPLGGFLMAVYLLELIIRSISRKSWTAVDEDTAS